MGCAVKRRRIEALESRRNPGAAAKEEQRRRRVMAELKAIEAGEIEDPFTREELEAELQRRRGLVGRKHFGGPSGRRPDA